MEVLCKITNFLPDMQSGQTLRAAFGREAGWGERVKISETSL